MEPVKRRHTIFAAAFLAAFLQACSVASNPGNAAQTNGSNAAQANVAEVAEVTITNNSAAAADPRETYRALLDCAALMAVSARLTAQQAASGGDARLLGMEANLRRGRAGALNAYAVSAGGEIDMTMTAVNADRAARETAIAGGRGSATLAAFMDRINERADACYAVLG